jgi:chromosome partitioning protein
MTETKLAPVVAVLNMKGGVGKTTITAHVMRVLYHRCQTKTLLLDLDPQFNLTQTIVSRQFYEKLKEQGKTIFSAMEPKTNVGLFDITADSTPPPPVASLRHGLRHILNANPPITLDLIPGDFRLVKYSLISDERKLESVKARFLKFISEARKEYSLICLDCNPSSSFITSCALHACQYMLVPVRPDRYSVLGLELLVDLLGTLPTVNPKPQTIILLNGIPRQKYDATIENELRAHDTFGSQVIAGHLRYSRLLEARGDYTGFATDKPVPYRELLRTEIGGIVDELAKRLGLKT